MDNQVVAQAITLTMIGVGTAFSLLMVLMLSIKIMSYLTAKISARDLMNGNKIDTSINMDNNKDKVVAASLGVAAYRTLLSKEKVD
tara:strand:+ start:430 stop:687 length:258 start_codon:yes stop_codon:yes gene_type:complete